MASLTVATIQGNIHHGGLRILPEGGHEVPAILVFTVQGRIYALGNIKEDLKHPTDVMIRLGSKVSEGHPSCIGFRVLLRTDTPKSETSGSIDDHYHVVSCKFDPSGGNATYAKATAQNKQDLRTIRLPQNMGIGKLKAGYEQDLYLLNFDTSDTNGCFVSHHGPGLQTTKNDVKKVEKLMSFLPYTNRLSLYFIADRLLIKHLAKAMRHDYVGAVAPCWKTALPDNTDVKWPSNEQTQMVAGMTDVLNVLLGCLREEPLLGLLMPSYLLPMANIRRRLPANLQILDGQGTSLADRSEAKQFNDFVHKAYPNIQSEEKDKAFPVMLNVSGCSLCTELPFGASMLNRVNTYAAINALHKLLATGIPATRIGLVTLYPTQVEAYRSALDRCHNHLPDSGYNHVQLDILENWAQKKVGIAIVDLVRTANASGNLGFLSQTNRLKALLTIHENGLIIVGDRACTTTSHGTVTSAKLEKVLQWFVDHGRIVQISEKGVALTTAQYPQTISSTEEATPHNAHLSGLQRSSTSKPESGQSQQQPKYVGIPGLEHLKIGKPPSVKVGGPNHGDKKKKELSAIEESFARQGFSIKDSHRARSETSTDNDASSASVSNDSIQLSNTYADPYTSLARQGLKLMGQEVGPEVVMKGLTGNISDTILSRSSIPKLPSDQPKIPTVKKEEHPDSEPARGYSSKPSSSKQVSSITKPYSPSAEVAVSNTKGPKAVAIESSSQASKKLLESVKVPVGSTALPAKPSIPDAFSEKAESVTQGMNFTRPKNSSDSFGAPLLKASKNDSLHMNSMTQTDETKSFPGIASNDVSSLSTLSKSNRKENIQPKAVTGLSSPEQYKKPLPHEALPKPSTELSSKAAAQESAPKNATHPVQASHTPNLAPTTDQTSSQTKNSDATKISAERKPGVVNTAQTPTFKDKYLAKYRAIRVQFRKLDSQTSLELRQEDRLFRRLAEAFTDENEKEFGMAYTDLLGLAVKLQTSVLQRK